MNSIGTLIAVTDFGADGVWARHTQATDWFYTFDPQGCLSQKVGRDGSVLCSSLYDAQGHEATTDTHPDPFSGFGGQWGYYGDWETSGDGGGSCLYLLGHRFYDPNTGRFLTRDPIGYRGGVNLYGYTGNDPVNRVDPSGLDPIAANNGGSSGNDPCCKGATSPYDGYASTLGGTIGAAIGGGIGGTLGVAAGTAIGGPIGGIIGGAIGGGIGGALGGGLGAGLGDILDNPGAKDPCHFRDKDMGNGALYGGIGGAIGGGLLGLGGLGGGSPISGIENTGGDGI